MIPVREQGSGGGLDPEEVVVLDLTLHGPLKELNAGGWSCPLGRH